MEVEYTGRPEECGELGTGEYHAQYERSSGWVWTGGLEARQGVGTQDWGSPYTTLKQNSQESSIHCGIEDLIGIQRRVRSWGSTQEVGDMDGGAASRKRVRKKAKCEHVRGKEKRDCKDCGGSALCRA